MKIKIEFEIEVKEPTVPFSDDDLEEFLRFEFRDNGSMHTSNPFNNQDGELAPIFWTFEYRIID